MTQTTQQRAAGLLFQLKQQRSTVKRLQELEPILKAAADGQAIQYRVKDPGEGPPDWTDTSELTFSDPPHMYRIKPETQKVRRFWWKSSLQMGFRYISPYAICIVTEKEQAQEPREKWAGFISWIDNDWQEFEVPTF